MNILQKIADRTYERVALNKKRYPMEQIREDAMTARATDGVVNALARVYGKPKLAFPFEMALHSDDIAFIAEVKRASPSKGIITEKFPYLQIAKDYEAAGAAAISVLTEPFWFKGDDDYLREIAEVVRIPILRKDFVIDEYMIYEAKLMGASAVLLICALLDLRMLVYYIEIAHGLGLSALVEVHDATEIDMALRAEARVIGVNNRCLKTFEVDISLSERLKKMVPPNVLFVSESGLSTPEDIQRLREISADAALIGESFMRSEDKISALKHLRGF